MNLRPFAITDADGLEKLRPVLLHALAEMSRRSGGRYKPERVLDRLKADLPLAKKFALWVVVDTSMRDNGVQLNEAVVGVTTINLVFDEIGSPAAFISRGWGRGKCGGPAFDTVLPYVEKWARERGAVRLIMMTERSSAAAGVERLGLRLWIARLRGLLAYARWAVRRGFVMRETIFEKELKP